MDILINELFYSWLFLLLGFIFLFLEIFIPSGGILGVLALAVSSAIIWELVLGRVSGQPVTEHGDGLASRALRSVWTETHRRLREV